MIPRLRAVSVSSVASKEPERDRMAAQIDEFVSGGGKIRHIPTQLPPIEQLVTTPRAADYRNGGRP